MLTDDTVVETMMFLVMGILALGLDQQIARTMSGFSEFGERFRKHRVWGTAVRRPDPATAYQSFLSFVRLWGSVMALLGIGLFLLSS